MPQFDPRLRCLSASHSAVVNRAAGSAPCRIVPLTLRGELPLQAIIACPHPRGFSMQSRRASARLALRAYATDAETAQPTQLADAGRPEGFSSRFSLSPVRRGQPAERRHWQLSSSTHGLLPRQCFGVQARMRQKQQA